MVVEMLDEDRADLVLHALADATRRDIVRRSMTGRHSVSALARKYPMSVTAVQKHVGVLEAAGLVHKRRQGREQRVRTDITVVRAAARLLDDLEATWRDRVARMDALLAEDQPEDPDPTNTEGDT